MRQDVSCPPDRRQRRHPVSGHCELAALAGAHLLGYQALVYTGTAALPG